MRFIAERLDKAEVINYLCEFGFEDIDCVYADDDVMYVQGLIPVVLSSVRLSLEDGQLPVLDAQAAEIERLQTENAALHATLSDHAKKWTDEKVKAALDECLQFADIVAVVFGMRDDFVAEIERLETVAEELVEARYQASGDRLAAEQAVVRLRAENAALRAELADWRRWGPAPDWIDLPDPDENDEIALPDGYAICQKVAV